jgi:23S rRNA (uridine2552-2'-O)-methyltransferase
VKENVKTQRPASKNKWNDHYAQKARRENFPARSVYKLEEMQQKYRLIRKGDRVLDLGCAPGSWLLLAAQLTGETGHVTGIDLKLVTIGLPPHVTVYQGDVYDMENLLSENRRTGYNIILSDMAPNTTGNRNVDADRSEELCRRAFAIAETCLAPGGCFVCKIFQGRGFQSFTDMIKGRFDQVKIYKPEACRKESKEIYIIARGKKQEESCQGIANGPV